MKKEFKSQTVGMQAYHANMHSSTLVVVEYYKTSKGIELHAVSGRNGDRIRSVKTVVISSDEYNNRLHDYFDNTVEFFWACGQLGFDFDCDQG